jgi:hypothetical protein
MGAEKLAAAQCQPHPADLAARRQRASSDIPYLEDMPALLLRRTGTAEQAPRLFQSIPYQFPFAVEDAASNRIRVSCASVLSRFKPTPDPSVPSLGRWCVPGPKGPEWFGASLKQKEDTMKLVSRFEAASYSTPELHGLLGEALLAFAAAPRSSQERRDVLDTIRNIEKELATRAPGR